MKKAHQHQHFGREQYQTLLGCPLHCHHVIRTHLADPVVFGEPVVVEDSEHEGLVEGVGVREILELKSFIEEWIQGFSVNFRLKLFLAFLGW